MMESLDRIQKTVHIVKIIALVCMIAALVLSVVQLAVSTCMLVPSLAAKTQLVQWIEDADLGYTGSQAGGTFRTSGLSTLLNAVVLGFAWFCLKREEDEGTPFTTAGAGRLRSLGLLVSVAQLAIAAFSSSLGQKFQLLDVEGLSLPGLLLGFFLVLGAMVLQYGAELED